jgi:hypothetical protein
MSLSTHQELGSGEASDDGWDEADRTTVLNLVGLKASDAIEALQEKRMHNEHFQLCADASVSAAICTWAKSMKATLSLELRGNFLYALVTS